VIKLQIKMKKILFSTLIISLALILGPKIALAYDFGYALSDTEFVNKDALSLKRIQSFLEGKGSYLATYNLDVNGETLRASDIIYKYTQEYSINPKVILIKLQNEQSLITAKNPTEKALNWAMSYGICDDCSYSDPDIQGYIGFTNQIERSTYQFDRYLRFPDSYSIQVGDVITKYNQQYGTQTFEVKNQATRALGIYTTSLSGITMVKDYINTWFELAYYPNGSLLQDANSGEIYMIQNNKRRLIMSLAALYSNYNPNALITVSPDVLDQYEDGYAIKFVENTLIRSPKGTVYLVTNGEKRGFASGEAFRQFGFNPEEILDVGWGDLAALAESEPITISETFPVGGLLQAKETGAVFYISSEGVVYPIWDKSILKTNFKTRHFISMNLADIKKYQQGNPLKFQDGTLITSPGTTSVYVISNGQKRPFDSAETFTGLGYQWENIVHTTDAVLSLHSTGNFIDLN